jgi:PAS domain S-box-containing protein
MPEAKRKVEPGREAAQEAPLEAAFKLVASLPVPVFFKSRDGRYLGVNRAWEEFFGVSRAEFVGKKVADLYPQEPAIAERHARMDEELYAKGGGQSYEIPIRTPWGALRHTIYYKSTYPGADGAAVGLVGAIVDITDRKHAEAALRESEERYRRTFELAGSGVAHIALDRRFIRVNRRLCEILGYTESELLQLTGRQISHPDDLDVINAQRPRLYAGQIDRVHVEKRYVRKDRSTVWVAFTMVVERDAEGKPLYEIAIFDDITARKHAEDALRDSETRFRQTFELAGSGMAHVSLEGRFLRVNRRLCDILGRSETDLIGKSVKEISHPEDRDLTDRHRGRVRAGEVEVAHFEKRYLRADDRTVWVDLAVALARNAEGAPLYEIAVFDDITERKNAEAALREAHEELKRSNSELEQFAYVASHDLQEPLRMVSSYTQLVMRRYGDRLDGDAKEFMNYVVDGAARMKQLIEDLLAYSRVGTKGKEFRPIDVEAALRRAITNLRSAIEEAGASVTWDPLPKVSGDDVQLAQLFQNLIGNALKFRGASVPRVHVLCSDQAKQYEIIVTDNGIGIEPQYFERIFMVFQRLHTKGDYPGTGIGLAICKKVVERHGGAIWVTSQPGEGSQFHFTLPKKPQDEERRA